MPSARFGSTEDMHATFVDQASQKGSYTMPIQRRQHLEEFLHLGTIGFALPYVQKDKFLICFPVQSLLSSMNTLLADTGTRKRPCFFSANIQQNYFAACNSVTRISTLLPHFSGLNSGESPRAFTANFFARTI